MIRTLFPIGLAAGLLAAAAAAAEPVATERAAWLLGRAAAADFAPAETRHFQSDVGLGFYDSGDVGPEGVGSAGLRLLASAVLPGAGEALGGHKRGFVMMAVDIFAWTRVAKYHGDGKDLSDAYYAFADLHYTDERLVEGYNPSSTDQERSGEGAIYFPGIGAINDVSELENLTLYVSKEDDRREYYENLGKWDQFIFGWDDYTRASVSHPEYGYEPTMTISDLHQPWVSRNREVYRDMRDAANNAYQKRDRWLYVNIGLRVFSVLQTAWLDGLLGGGDGLAVLGHDVKLAAAPRGAYGGTVQATVSF